MIIMIIATVKRGGEGENGGEREKRMMREHLSCGWEKKKKKKKKREKREKNVVDGLICSSSFLFFRLLLLPL